jgi:hypothetical protein
MPDITNAYQLIAFLCIIAFQAYTRWTVARLARKQDLMNVQHDAGRAELLRLLALTVDRIAGRVEVPHDDLVEAVQAALKVSYLQGQADLDAGRPFPTERAATAARQLVDVIVQAARPGPGPPPAGGTPPDDLIGRLGP